MLLPSISGWWTEPDMGNQQSSCLGGSKPATRFYKFYQINKLLGGGGQTEYDIKLLKCSLIPVKFNSV